MNFKKYTVGLLSGTSVVLFALVLAPSVEAGGRGPRPGTNTSTKSWGRYPYLGNANAKVIIEVFGGFQCPWTRRLAPVLPKIAQAFPKKVKVVWRDFPLPMHRRSMPAAIAAREVFRQRGTTGFMIIGTKIFTNYTSLTDQNLVLWAGQAGANTKKVQHALNTNKYRATIQAEMKKAKTRGVRGTPTILINGTPYRGSRTLSAFSQTINAL